MGGEEGFPRGSAVNGADSKTSAARKRLTLKKTVAVLHFRMKQNFSPTVCFWDKLIDRYCSSAF